MSDIQSVFHIGANKAGSTTLQQALFAHHPDVLNLARPQKGHAEDRLVDDLLHACDRANANGGYADVEATRQRWRKIVMPAAETGRVPVFSREDLIRGQYYGDPDPQRFPRLMRAVTGDIRVVIVTRNQKTLIESLYIHKTSMQNYMPFDQWLKNNPVWLSSYLYNQVADAWINVVGKENVGVFLFEELANEPAAFADRLCRFIGIDPDQGARLLTDKHENVRKSLRMHLYAQARSALLPKASLGRALPKPVKGAWRRFLEGGPRSKATLPSGWSDPIEDYYRESNQHLAQRFDLPLSEHGYPV